MVVLWILKKKSPQNGLDVNLKLFNVVLFYLFAACFSIAYWGIGAYYVGSCSTAFIPFLLIPFMHKIYHPGAGVDPERHEHWMSPEAGGASANQGSAAT